MPREGVPYPERMLCSLKCAVARIEQALGLKMNSVNGVGPDGQGDVKLISDSSALSVTDDPVQHEVHLDLDTSLLPAALVDSVNGQTGTVALTADDIPSDGSSDVQTDIDALKAADTTLQGNINAEALARSGADSTLQTNINAVTAGIPTEIGNQLAADTTIVRTSGNQNIADVKTVTTEATGTYSQQIANSQKVKNELDNYAPMVRTSGNQTIAGIKTIEGLIKTPMETTWFSISFSTGRYVKVCSLPNGTNFNFEMEMMGYSNKLMLHAYKDGSTISGFALWINTDDNQDIEPFIILNSTTGLLELWIHKTGVGRFFFYPSRLLFVNTSQAITATTLYATNTNTDPYGTSDYQTGGTNNPKILIPTRIVGGTIINI